MQRQRLIQLNDLCQNYGLKDQLSEKNPKSNNQLLYQFVNINKSYQTYKATLLPQSVESDEIQTGCDSKELVAETVNAILKISAPLAVGVGPLKVIAKYGLDGSGSHNVRHQQSSSEEEPSKADPSYIGSFWCPLEIKDTNGETIWTNPLPNSPIYARPVSLVRAKENRENVAEYFEPTLVKLQELETTQSTTSTGVQFMVKTEVSMVDGKMEINIKY